MTEKTTKQSYWPELDGLRAVAILLVFLHHCTPFRPEGGAGIQWAIYRLSVWGWMGVDLFFVLSGFLITYLLLKERSKFNSISLPLFYARRALRIWPLYFLALAGAALYPLLSHGWDSGYARFLEVIILPMLFFVGNYSLMVGHADLTSFANAAHLHSRILTSLTSPFWSISVEEQFYLLWPTILLFTRSARSSWITMSSLFCLALLARLFFFLCVQGTTHGHRLYYMNTPTHLDALMVGAALATAEFSHPGWFARFTHGARPWLLLSIVVTVLVGIVNSAPYISAKHISIVAIMTVLPLVFGMALLLVMNWAPLRKLIGNPIMAWIGRISYSMYIFHNLCIYWVLSFIPIISPNMFTNWSFIFLASLAVTIAVSQLSWWLIETPMNRMRHKFTRKGPSADIPATAPVPEDSATAKAEQNEMALSHSSNRS
jgi:peptidoglycan/LPS O-acetylase OafA/YrhL